MLAKTLNEAFTRRKCSVCLSPRICFIGQHFEARLKRGCQLPSLLTDITIMHFTKSHYLFILAERLKVRQHLATIMFLFMGGKRHVTLRTHI